MHSRVVLGLGCLACQRRRRIGGRGRARRSGRCCSSRRLEIGRRLGLRSAGVVVVEGESGTVVAIGSMMVFFPARLRLFSLSCLVCYLTAAKGSMRTAVVDWRLLMHWDCKLGSGFLEVLELESLEYGRESRCELQCLRDLDAPRCRCGCGRGLCRGKRWVALWWGG